MASEVNDMLDDVSIEENPKTSKKNKKSRWRDIEKVRDNIRLLKALKEIDAD